MVVAGAQLAAGEFFSALFVGSAALACLTCATMAQRVAYLRSALAATEITFGFSAVSGILSRAGRREAGVGGSCLSGGGLVGRTDGLGRDLPTPRQTWGGAYELPHQVERVSSDDLAPRVRLVEVAAPGDRPERLHLDDRELDEVGRLLGEHPLGLVVPGALLAGALALKERQHHPVGEQSLSRQRLAGELRRRRAFLGPDEVQ